MKIVFAASEGVPFCKTGGLADVVSALSGALAAKRHTVRVFLPFYRQIREKFPQVKTSHISFPVTIGGEVETVELFETSPRANLTFYFLGSPRYFDRPGVYGPTPSSDFGDNDRRFALYARGVLEACRALQFSPDIIHAHDWQAGLLGAYLKSFYGNDSFLKKTATVFSIHNMAYQGNFPAATFSITGLPPEAFSMNGAEFYGKFSYLKAGLTYADAINTVSPTYAKEISTDPAFGCGMEGVLQRRRDRFEGILNGLDTALWDPRADSYLARPFSLRTLEARAACKADLQKSAGLIVDAGVPVIAFVGRLDYQKGIDLLLEGAPQFLKRGAQFVSLGQGHLDYTAQLREIKQLYPSQVSVETAFAEPLAHKIYGGADIFVMPSRYEPCGLSQLIAMRYGAIPVVTPTGGLLDTVRDQTKHAEGTGFVAANVSAGAILSAIVAALNFYGNSRAWHALQQRAMSQDFSWRKSVQDYLLLYEAAKGFHHG